ncbi:MAG TPA: hypothetical protein VK716_05245 [Terracidiphilus sp.]|jgi:hypothetical protein|nr:hypothetical protein [Terracidiphilus sp.]
MKVLGVALGAVFLTVPLAADSGAELRVDFRNPALTPSNWTMVVHPDGSAHFRSDRGSAPGDPQEPIEPVVVDKEVRLSEPFVDRVFDTVHKHNLLNLNCESHYKVAFQGWKKLTYTGPDGSGGCEFNYSKDHEIEELGESFVAVASTIIEGARLELLRQHDPLGLDKEMEYLTEAAGDGRLQQLCAIRGILQKLQDDPDVMERVRKRARVLLALSAK